MTDLNKLRWRCRRGALELDVLLLRYLEKHFETADCLEQKAFERLLELEDAQLMRYLMGEQEPAEPELSHLLTRIRMSSESGQKEERM